MSIFYTKVASNPENNLDIEVRIWYSQVMMEVAERARWVLLQINASKEGGKMRWKAKMAGEFA